MQSFEIMFMRTNENSFKYIKYLYLKLNVEIFLKLTIWLHQALLTPSVTMSSFRIVPVPGQWRVSWCLQVRSLHRLQTWSGCRDGRRRESLGINSDEKIKANRLKFLNFLYSILKYTFYAKSAKIIIGWQQGYERVAYKISVIN